MAWRVVDYLYMQPSVSNAMWLYNTLPRKTPYIEYDLTLHQNNAYPLTASYTQAYKSVIVMTYYLNFHIWFPSKTVGQLTQLIYLITWLCIRKPTVALVRILERQQPTSPPWAENVSLWETFNEVTFGVNAWLYVLKFMQERANCFCSW